MDSINLTDTGAEIDAIPYKDFHEGFPGVKLQHANAPHTANTIMNDGKFPATLRWQTRDGSRNTTQTEVQILHNLSQAVLSKNPQMQPRMLHEDYPHTKICHIETPAKNPSAMCVFPNMMTRKVEEGLTRGRLP